MRSPEFERALKRAFDLVAASLALLVFSPILLVLSAAVVVSMGRPVLFRQRRPGLDGRPFWILKFRTMKNATDPAGRPLPDEQRLTKVGKFLRASSLDELPELWNVVLGEMSLVGPRPLLMQYLSRYSPRQARRHEVRPGITGWAQINGRNALSWEQKFELDIWYLENRSLALDIAILFKTVAKVFRREGISAGGHATMPEFLGTTSQAGPVGNDAGAGTLSKQSSRPIQVGAPGVYVIGGGGHAKVVIATLQAAGFEVAGVWDDNSAKWGTQVLGIPVIGPAPAKVPSTVRAVLAIGDNATRKRVIAKFDSSGLAGNIEWVTAVHPKAAVHSSVRLGVGTVVFAGAVVQPDADIGAHVILNTGCSIDHDSRVSDFAHIAPGARLAGAVQVGEGSLLGIGSSAIPGVSIGDWTVIGAGAAVVNNIGSAKVAMGTPAREQAREKSVRRA